MINIYKIISILCLYFLLSAALASAATYFLPDYLSDNKGFRDPQGLTNPPAVLKCSDYNGYSDACPAPQTGSSVRLTSMLTCVKECACPKKFQYTADNCKNGSTLDGEICDGKFETCRAPECSKLCNDFEEGKICLSGQTSQLCGSGCGDWVKCTGEACEQGFSCELGCSKYSENPNCVGVCIECKKAQPLCEAPNVIKETYWCDSLFSCWEIPSDDVCKWCNEAWRCLMP